VATGTQRHWARINAQVSAFETALRLEPWDLTLRVVIYRKHVGRETRKNFQLDLLSPDDGHFEYSAVTTNEALARRHSGPSLPAEEPRTRGQKSTATDRPPACEPARVVLGMRPRDQCLELRPWEQLE
jgi:hypothetical protein